MSITHVQGTSGGGSDPQTIALTGVTAGNCLVLSVAVEDQSGLHKFIVTVTDTGNNVWTMVAGSPVVADGGGNSFQEYIFVAPECSGGNITITVNSTSALGAKLGLTVDEYSGVYDVQPWDGFTFNSTVYGSGLNTLASGSFTAVSGELIYCVAMTGESGDTFSTPSGYTARQSNNSDLSIANFDKLSSGGSESTTINSSGTPNTLHVCMIALSPVAISRPLVQFSVGAASGTSTESCTATFNYPNTAGNTLVAFAYFYERLDPVFTDTQGNTWVLLYGSPSGPTGTFAVAYCESCKGGTPTVTLNTTSGGDDVQMLLIIAEYRPLLYVSSNYGSTSSGTSVNTGDVSVVTAPALLISGFFGGATTADQAYLPALNLGTLRFQVSDSGFVNLTPQALAIADQLENSPGSYDNVFTQAVTGSLQAAILGFTIPPLSLACPLNNVGTINVPYSGQLVASYGTPPYTFAIIAGALPPGLSLNASTGLISGTPTNAGSYPYTAQVTDSLDAQATATCLIQIPAVTKCGQMPTLEITLDDDGDWGDSSTFFITQDQPFPFTLRGIVLRVSYNLD
jgi:Putative Ig domain